MRPAIAFVALAIAGGAPAPSPWVKCTVVGASNGIFEVSIESPGAIDTQAHTTIVLEPHAPQPSAPSAADYWAPVDLTTGRPYGANQPRHLILKSGQRLVAALSPTNLGWDRQISSAWPQRTLQEAVPPGRYSLHLEIEDTLSTHRARSNELAVVVDEATIRTVQDKR